MMENECIEKEYIIHEHTMCILPYYTVNGELYSLVLERYRAVKVAMKPLRIIDESCMFYGSSRKGRTESAHSILSGKKMLPVMISLTHKLCMIPTCSPLKSSCVWLAYQHVMKTFENSKGQAQVLFTNHNRMNITITKKTLLTKLDIAGRLISTYDFRYNNINDLSEKNTIAEDYEAYVIDPKKYKV